MWNDFGLTEDDAWPVLWEWNRTCRPPWAEPDLRRKLAEAEKKGPNDRGWRVHRPASAPATPAGGKWRFAPVRTADLLDRRSSTGG